MTTREEQKAMRQTIIRLVMLAIAMFAFCFWVLPPLYTLFCEVTGINGKTSSEPYQVVSAEIDTSRTVTVKFIATKNSEMPWAFAPESFSVDVHPGEATTTFFLAHNPTQKIMVGQAVPSMAPKNAINYFHKTECFCFNQQLLIPDEQAQLGLRFIVDQALPKAVKSITLSYTLFDVTKDSQSLIEQYQEQALLLETEPLLNILPVAHVATKDDVRKIANL